MNISDKISDLGCPEGRFSGMGLEFDNLIDIDIHSEVWAELSWVEHLRIVAEVQIIVDELLQNLSGEI